MKILITGAKGLVGKNLCSLDYEIDKTLSEIQKILGIDIK